MIFDIARARKITEETIQFGVRHADYAKTVEIANKSRIFVTGEDQDTEYLVNFREGETEKQKNVRIKTTKPITPFALNPVKTQYEKMWRVDGVRLDIRQEKDQGDKLATLNEAIDTYHANSPLSEYFRRRYLHYQFLDPNAWMITERRNQYDPTGRIVTKVDVYPFEVTSQQAVNYKYDNGVPVWLVVKQTRVEVIRELGKDDEEKKFDDYYFYASGISLAYRQIDTLPLEILTGVEYIKIEQGEGDDDKFFELRIYETGSTEFPGQKFGAYDDPQSDGTLKVPPFWTGARFLLEDLIGKKSSFDVSVYSHVFPKLFHYDEACTYQAQNGEQCQKGYIGGNKSMECPQCGGTGGLIHLSEMDVVTFQIPKHLEDLSKLPALSGMAYYHEPPLNVTEALYKWINELREWVYLASFNTSNVEKPVAPKTATEIDKLWDEINTRVYPCAAWWSRLTEKAVRIAAQYLEVQDVKVKHTVPMDMKLEPLDVLIERYERAKNTGLPYDAIWAISCDILGKTFIDAPAKVGEVKTWENWKPFKSQSAEAVAIILQNRAWDDTDRILYENWDTVQREVNQELAGKAYFSELEITKQWQMIQAALEKIKVSIKTAQIQPVGMPDFLNGQADEEE